MTHIIQNNTARIIYVRGLRLKQGVNHVNEALASLVERCNVPGIVVIRVEKEIPLVDKPPVVDAPGSE